ncbi:polysaccharide polymerase [Alishewanella longhuensis]|uniref:Polysaccharide polymerase n=1 Tax=Alishewanella longhuensis TaxID=1091037 RepID=A0ABQ3KYM6_9ALTE|nr:O-antigen ligase family protein [Alishewanella longhuensis]GHG68032.1 polysaccharide polymerase [Alishewanella longhuensis]
MTTVSDINTIKSKETTLVQLWLFFYVFSFFIPAINLDIGFSLKIFMPLSVLTLLVFFNRLKLNINTTDFLWVIFICLGFVSVSLSIDLEKGFRLSLGALIIYFCYLVFRSFLFYCVERNIKVESVFLVVALIFSSVSLILYFIGLKSIGINVLSFEGQRVYGVLVDRAIPRLIGVVQDPNIFIYYASIFIFYFGLKKQKAFLDILCLVLLALCCLLTVSRGGLLALILVFSLVFINSFFRFLLRPKFTLSFFAGLLSLIVFIYIAVLFLSSVDDVISIIERRLSSAASGSGRFEIWINGLSLWQQSPLFGIGWHNFLYYNSNFFMRDNYAHNTFLEVLVETGIVGFTIYFLFFLSFFYSILKVINSDSRKIYLLFTFVAMVLMLNNLSLIISEATFFLMAVVYMSLYKIKLSKS